MSAHPVDTHVGKRLRLRRSMLGMSQDFLGKEIGVTFQQIQKYERGVNRIGSSRLYDFSKILNVPVEYFFEDLSGQPLEIEGNAKEGFSEKNEDKFKVENLDNKETLSLIKAYYRIEDVQVRKKVLSLIKVMGSNNE